MATMMTVPLVVVAAIMPAMMTAAVIPIAATQIAMMQMTAG